MIEVKVERVRKKARLDESYDEDIQDTIEEMTPFIESKIDKEYLNTEDTSIQSIINLGATEIIIGEFIKEQSNDEDDSVSLGVGPIKIGENSSSKNRMSRAKDFVNDGWEKLKPYLIQDEDPFYFGIMGG
ncbi:hypothetical protein RBU61_08305 [Tissierella sp. MB52-C2]|uniref:hypothetical protein n=1 Tax=Tissierella sp. MB52-C2 TaxID=3070999 RepID=UPI00280AEC1E|nr:hypothetical protein [Tissierella sp. MB52-C2]WMM26666.1 hypothetical protein RBU61_08305 [Tissierella sp. MB52-C2]